MTKLTAITEDTTPGSDSLLYTVDDPSGTPTEKKVTLANLTTFQNIGIGSNYSDTFGLDPAPSIVFTGITLTDPATKTALKRSIMYLNTTSNTTSNYMNQKVHTYPTVASGITNSGFIYGVQAHTLRNSAATDSDDDGTLGQQMAAKFTHGHSNLNAAATPITSNSYGVTIYGQCNTGTIGTAYDLYIWSNDTGGTITGTHYAIYQVESTTPNYFGGVVNFNNYVVQKFTVTTDNTDGVDTYTAAQLLGRIIRRGTGDEITAARIDVTDTAANIVAAIPKCQVGSGFDFYVLNEDSTHTIQVSGGVGVTMSPNAPSTAIPANSVGHFAAVVTNATASSEAVTIHCLGIIGN
jgi:hypothetical protein